MTDIHSLIGHWRDHCQSICNAESHLFQEASVLQVSSAGTKCVLHSKGGSHQSVDIVSRLLRLWKLLVWQCKVMFSWITTSQKLTKSFSIEASPESESGITIRKKTVFFEERKIDRLFSAILMVALRGADCGIFRKLKHFFITAKLCRKERNMIQLSWTLRAHVFQDKWTQRKASPSIASLLWAYWNWCEHHLYQNIWLLIVWHDTVITIDWLMLGIWNSNSSYLNPKMEKTTTPANNEVKQFAMEIVKASRSVFWWIVL